MTGLLAAPAYAADPVDLGDAPASYDNGNPARAALVGPRLGTAATADQPDLQQRASTHASDAATRDSGDEAVRGFDRMRTGRLATFRSTIGLSRVTQPARVCGWVDFDQSGTFSGAERACATAASGSTQVKLTWVGRLAGVGTSYVRLRVGSDAAQVEHPTGPSSSGEVEDYPVSFVAAAAEPGAAISLTKTATPTRINSVGQTITYTYVAKNTGTVPLTRVVVTDELLGLSELTCANPATLAAGASTTCTATREVTQDDLDFGAIFNFAGVTAEAPSGDPDDASDDVTALDDATVTVDVDRDLDITSQASATQVSEGTRVAWTFTATNAGNVTLDGVRISTSLKGMSSLTCAPATGATLSPGAAMTCTGEYTVTRADAERRKVSLTATVRGDAPYGDPTTQTDDVVAEVKQTLTVAKPAGGSGGTGGGSDPSGSPATGTGADGEGLADTGGPAISASLGFGALSLTGAALTGAGRRRRRG
jgi:uncharacterized repeat protein (TIGR01451 family)